MNKETAKTVILFDGVCNLCNSSVQFILKRDRKNRFLFGSLQGKAGQHYLQQFRLPANDFNSFILVEGEKSYTRSAAVLHMLNRLGGPWRLFYVFMIIPPFIRNGVYNTIARNRYKWFGKKEQCPAPGAGLRSRFLD
jgi:predicted DCC family thiol-disulfide oxidoreductase YuxK